MLLAYTQSPLIYDKNEHCNYVAVMTNRIGIARYKVALQGLIRNYEKGSQSAQYVVKNSHYYEKQNHNGMI